MIIWGTHLIRKRLGYVAEFCPTCRDARQCHVECDRVWHHLYFIPLIPGDLVNARVRCAECRTPLPPDSVHAGEPTKLAHLPLDELIQQTNPRLLDRVEAEVQRELDILEGRASHEERLQFFAEALCRADTRVPRPAGTEVSSFAALSVLLMIVTCFILFLVGEANGWRTELSLTAIFGVAAVLLGLAIYEQVTHRRRKVRRKVGKEVVATLAPFDPTAVELRDAQIEAGHRGSRDARYFPPQWLLPRIEALRGKQAEQ